jgi:hypothetical protein
MFYYLFRVVVDMVSSSYTTKRYFSRPQAVTDIDLKTKRVRPKCELVPEKLK